MSDIATSSFAISLATITTPWPDDRSGRERHVLGAGIFHVREVAPDDFEYEIRTNVRDVWVEEMDLIRRLIDWVPADARMIGWRLAQDIVPAIFDVIDTAAPEEAHRLAERLTKAIRSGTTDLARDHAETGGASFEQVCAQHSIPVAEIPELLVKTAWTTGRTSPISLMMATNAIAAWRLAIADDQRSEVLHDLAEQALERCEKAVDASVAWEAAGAPSVLIH